MHKLTYTYVGSKFNSVSERIYENTFAKSFVKASAKTSVKTLAATTSAQSPRFADGAGNDN